MVRPPPEALFFVCADELPCSGIPPGGNFDYEIAVDTSGQWGTYWVHSHASVRLRVPVGASAKPRYFPPGPIR